jgi:hypothetical protein
MADSTIATSRQWDLFLSYASEDREEVADPLAHALSAAGLKVWYDQFALRPGDKLRRSIEQGLRESYCGVVILSPNFFAKEWPQLELDALFELSTFEAGRKIIPIWYRLNARDVAKHALMLSDRLALRWEQGLTNVAKQILVVVQESGDTSNDLLSIKALAHVQQLLEQDKLAEIDAYHQVEQHPIDTVCSALRSVFFSSTQALVMRRRALQKMVEYDSLTSVEWDRLVVDSSTELIGMVMEVLAASTMVLKAEQVRLLLDNPKLPRSATGLGSLIVRFIRRGAGYTSSIFLPARDHPAWAVKYDCVRSIIKLDDQDSIATLVSFANMSYWKARRNIIDYIDQRHSTGRLAEAERQVAAQILKQILTDGKTTEKTPTRSKARKLLAKIENQVAAG